MNASMNARFSTNRHTNSHLILSEYATVVYHLIFLVETGDLLRHDPKAETGSHLVWVMINDVSFLKS